MRDRPVISIENYTIYCGDADENKVGGCAIAVRNDYNNLAQRRLDASLETAENNSKDAFYDELNALIPKIPSQQVVIVGIDTNAKMGLEQQSDVLGKWYTAELTSHNEESSTPSAHLAGSTLLTPEEQRKRKMRTLKLQLDYVLARNIPQSDIRKSRAVWDVVFDFDHIPVPLSFKIRFRKRN
ncbi:hypothetical protein RB195_006218 [Necator americanus]|uniref:Endonuclease/exonuclease/phosphatase domain-containing protein n=1 Tax=Necator americanus TaxID=51031 RepID=A0ABR1BTD9_NECAM